MQRRIYFELVCFGCKMNLVIMKYCPKCGRNYYEDDISFCLEDGAVLSTHEIKPFYQNPVSFELPESDKLQSKSKLPIIIVILMLLFFGFLVGLGGVVFLYLSSSKIETANRRQQNENSAQFQVPNQDNKQVPENFNLDNPIKQIDEDKSKEDLKVYKESEDSSLDVSNKNETDKDKKDLEVYKGAENLEFKILTGKYSGTAVNQIGNRMSISLDLVQNGSLLSGRVSFKPPFVGSGKITFGYTDGKKVSFTSYNSEYMITIQWEGEIKGNKIVGNYVGSTTDPRIVPNPEYATWQVRKR